MRLPVEQIHEWVLEDGFASKSNYRWHNPLFFISALLGQDLDSHTKPSRQSLIAWVGRRSWPMPHVLEQTLPKTLGERPWDWKQATLFLNPPSKDKRLWSCIQLLHNPLTLAVVIDASGFDHIATRRLKLALAKTNASVFLLRPPWEAQLPSAAQTKWVVSPNVSLTTDLSWSVTLVRAPGLVAPNTWSVSYEKNCLAILPDVATPATNEGALQSAYATR